ncbi:hypothetical protein [Schlesneria paludicola]|uniref:hypothetical protein n=1 Tax=Schlesneria paludicola TaxID=360056 RepID=UPI00029ABB9B|nr:hypothetical protein [Schlesneria paludicola]
MGKDGVGGRSVIGGYTMAAAMAFAVTNLSGCVIVQNKYSLFDFDRLSEYPGETSNAWRVVVILLLAVALIGVGIGVAYLVQQWRARHNRNREP